MKDLFTKEYWKWNLERYRGLQKYIIAALKLPNVIMRLGMFFGFLLGIILFEISYYFTGSPYTLICIFIGVFLGLFVSEGLAKKQMLVLEAEEEAQAAAAAKAAKPEPTVVPVAVPAIYKFPYTIPDGTGWKNITMEFLDDEHVKISVDRWKHQASYIDFDMADKRAKTTKPGKQWLLLKILADLGGEVSFEDSEAKLSLKKQKQMLAWKLKHYFSMGDDPFWPYKQEHKYKIRSILIPLAANDGKPMVRDIEKDKFFTDDEPMEPGIPDPISDEEEDAIAQDDILDEQEANRHGFSIKSR